MSYMMMGNEKVTKCVLVEEGTKFYFKSSIKTMLVGFLQWATPEEAEERAAKGDPIEAPPNHYKLEPERQGRLVWMTGAPGLGKSTTAQLLSREHGYVFYEGDCFFGGRNPYIPSGVPEATLAQLKQAKLVGEGAKQRQEMVRKVNQEFIKMLAGEEHDQEVMVEGYRAMCADIKRERARMGGDWAVCCVLLTREIRDIVREELGQEVEIVCLEMEVEQQVARITARHAGDQNTIDMMKAIYDLCEPVGRDEPNASEVVVVPGKTPEEIAEMVLEKIGKARNNTQL